MYQSVEEIDLGSYIPIEQKTGQITLLRAVLTNVITGIGLLGIPYCFCAGIVTNIFLLLFY